MALPSEQELSVAIQQLKSYVELSDEDYELINTAALLLNISSVRTADDYNIAGTIPQTVYLDASNDYAPVLFSRKFNSSTNQFDTFVYTLTGQVYAPITPPNYVIYPPSSGGSGGGGGTTDRYGVIEVKYDALANTTQFSVDHQLSRVTAFVNSVPLTPIWINDTTGLVLTTPPTLPTQARPQEDYIETLLEQIKIVSDNLLTTATTISTDLDNVDTSITVLSTNSTTSNTKLDTLITNSTALNTATNSILTNTNTLTTSTASLTTSTANIKTKLDSLNFNGTALLTDSSATVQPISATALPLPTGAATQTTLNLIRLKTDNLDTNLNSLAKESGGNLDTIRSTLGTVETNTLNSANRLTTLNTELTSTKARIVDIYDRSVLIDTNLVDVNTNLTDILTKIPSSLTTLNSRLVVDGSAVTQPISATSLPLPSGAATSSRQDQLITLNTNIENEIISVKNRLVNTVNGLKVDGSAVTQPISVTSLPLPSGAATEAASQSIIVELGNITSDTASIDTQLGITNTRLTTINTSLGSLSTSALQTTANASLSSIDTKLLSIATTGRQDTTNTLLTTISNKDFATETSLAAIKDAILGNVNISESVWSDDSGTFFVRKVTFNEDTNSEVISFRLFDGVTTYIPSTNPKPAGTSATLSITQPLTDTQLRATAVPVSGNFYPFVQDVNATSLPLPTGASTSALQTSGNNVLTDIKNNSDSIVADLANISTNSSDISTNTSAISITNSRLNTVNTNLETLNTSIGVVNTSVGTTNTSLSTINGKLPIGLTVTANRLIVDGSSVTQPVSGTVTANTGLSQPLTDSELRAAAVSVSGTFYPAIQPVSAMVLPLPTGASTEATLLVINTTLNTVNAAIEDTNSLLDSVNTELDIITINTGNINTKLPTGLTVTSNKLIVDGSSVVQPISGTVTVSNLSSASSLTDTELRATPVPVTMISANTDIETILLAINSVASVNIISGGSGYTNGTAVTFTGGTVITNATGTIITSNGSVIGINITNPGQYTVSPTNFVIAGTPRGCTGIINMGSVVELDTDNLSTVRGYISNETTDSVSFEVSLDGYNWILTEVLNTVNNIVSNVASSANYPLSFLVNVSGTAKFRIRRTSITDAFTPRVFLNSSSDIAYVKTQTISSSSSTAITDAQLRASAVPVFVSTPIITRQGGIGISQSYFVVNTNLIVQIDLRNANSINVYIQYFNSIPITGDTPISGDVKCAVAGSPTNKGFVYINNNYPKNYGSTTVVALSTVENTYQPLTTIEQNLINFNLETINQV